MSNIKDFANKFIECKPSNTSGAIAHAGFTYQVYWALDRAIDNYKTGYNYAIVFDYHEDVVLLNDDINPTKGQFFQVKTKDNGVWKLGDLINGKGKKNGAKGPSILGKLHEHIVKFGNFVELIGFVSNAPIEIDLMDKSDSKRSLNFQLGEIDAKQQREFSEAMYDEISLAVCGHCLGCKLTFERSVMGILSPETYLVGRISEFLEDEKSKRGIRADHLNPLIFYRTVSEVALRRNKNKTVFSDFKSMIRGKSLTRNDFDKWIAEGIRSKSDYDLMEEVKNMLLPNLPLAKVKAVVTKTQNLLSKKLDVKYKILQRMSGKIKDEYEILLKDNDKLNFIDSCKELADKLKENKDFKVFDVDELIGYSAYSIMKDMS